MFALAASAAVVNAVVAFHPAYRDLCVLGQWRLWQGDTAGVQAAIGRLRGAAPPLRAGFPDADRPGRLA
jgi:hypothetical protein